MSAGPRAGGLGAVAAGHRGRAMVPMPGAILREDSVAHLAAQSRGGTSMLKELVRVACAVGALCLPSLPAAGQDPLWIRQFGTSGDDFAHGAAPDGAGGVYV